MPVILYDAKSRGAEAYLALAREVLERSRRHRGVNATHECDASTMCFVSSWKVASVMRHGKTPRSRQRPERAHSRRARAAHRRRPKSTSIACRRTTFSRARRSTTRGSRSWRGRSSRTASSSRSSCARSAIGFRSSPASAAGAPRRRPACMRVPVVVRDVAAGQERSLLEMALIENIQRENLNPIDEALAYRRLADDFQLTQEEIAAAVGKDRASVANSAPAEAARRSPRRSRGRARCRWATRARCWRCRRSRAAPSRARRHRAEPVGARNRVAGQEDRR